MPLCQLVLPINSMCKADSFRHTIYHYFYSPIIALETKFLIKNRSISILINSSPFIDLDEKNTYSMLQYN